MHLPDQDLAGFDRIKATRSGSRKTSSVPRAEQSFGLEVPPLLRDRTNRSQPGT
jgi:hypothetical protein